MKRILVVEDEESQQLLYQEEISDMGYQVEIATTGEQALEKVKKNRPDLVILDIKLPGISGLETLRTMLNDNPEIPVIINSAYSHYKEDFMSWAAEEYIVKSSDLTDLKQAIKRVLE